MRFLILILLLFLGAIQYRLWAWNDGVRELWRMEQAVVRQREENAALAERNRVLAAEVADLKKGGVAVEERARRELGLIAEGETFYQIVAER